MGASLANHRHPDHHLIKRNLPPPPSNGNTGNGSITWTTNTQRKKRSSQSAVERPCWSTPSAKPAVAKFVQLKNKKPWK